MKRYSKNLIVILAFAVGALATSAFTYTSSYFEVSKNLTIFNDVFKELNAEYVDEIDPADLMRTGIDAMLKSLDPYTRYISEAEIENFRMQTTGKYGGIGSIISKRGDYVMINEPYEGFPANKAGLEPGDIILKVDGKDVTNKSTGDVSSVLKGQPGTTLTLTVKKPIGDSIYGEAQEVVVTREEIKVANVPFSGMANVEKGIGYIRLGNFTEDAGEEVSEAFKALKAKHNLKGVILDLRGNPGGYLHEAVKISNIFIPKGKEVVSTKSKNTDWNKVYRTQEDPIDVNMPVVVLTNSGSASASEIVSGTLQDYDRGVIMGQRTFGKGLVQKTKPLVYNTQLKLTSSKYYTPSGRCIQELDYSNKDDKGKAKKLSDQKRNEFTTQNGRKVYDGGGIEPDIELEERDLATLTQVLLGKELIFDYATLYKIKHEKIAEPREFGLTDADFEDFKAFIATKDYSYENEMDKLLSDLEEVAKEEQYFEAINDQYVALKDKIDAEKQIDVNKYRKEIVQMLETEIISRYYFQQGVIKHNFKHDKEVEQAVDLLTNSSKYKSILTASK